MSTTEKRLEQFKNLIPYLDTGNGYHKVYPLIWHIVKFLDGKMEAKDFDLDFYDDPDTLQQIIDGKIMKCRGCNTNCPKTEGIFCQKCETK